AAIGHRTSWVTLWIVGIVGAGATILLAMAFGMTPADGLRTGAIAGGMAAAAAAAGGALLRALRSRSFGTQVVIVALTTIGAVAAGDPVAAPPMFPGSQ